MEKTLSSFSDSRNHFILLDALRGVAALIVIWYHCYEGFAKDIFTQSCNHGYLAVDFFFILSGFVIGYAYDERLRSGVMTTGQFIKRRLIRLHPMVVLGALFGMLTFILGGRQNWDAQTISTSLVMGALLLNMFMLPVIPGQAVDVRGNGEMFPLNGPNWSLFFEYVGNVLYVLLLRKLPTKALALVTLVLAVVLGDIVISSGYLGIGWTLPDFLGGLVRMLFPYCLGMLLSRLYQKRADESRPSIFPKFMTANAFWICSAALLVLLPMPFVGSPDSLWQNGLYVTVTIFMVFPALVWLAAEGSGRSFSRLGEKASKYLGDLSYPLYAIHYPVMYLFYQYIGFPNVECTMSDVWPIAIGAVILCISLAFASLMLYDTPVRKALSGRFLKQR